MMPYIVGGASGLLYLVAYFAYRWFVKKPVTIRTPRRKAGASGIFESAELTRLEETVEEPKRLVDKLKLDFPKLWVTPRISEPGLPSPSFGLGEPIVGQHVDDNTLFEAAFRSENPKPPRESKLRVARVLRVDPDKLEWEKEPAGWRISYGDFQASIEGYVIESPTNVSALSPIELTDGQEAFLDEHELLPRDYRVLSGAMMEPCSRPLSARQVSRSVVQFPSSRRPKRRSTNHATSASGRSSPLDPRVRIEVSRSPRRSAPKQAVRNFSDTDMATPTAKATCSCSTTERRGATSPSGSITSSCSAGPTRSR